MADTKFSALTAVTTPATTDEFAVNQGGTSKKITAEQIRLFAVAPSNYSTASQAITANTVTYLTGSGVLIPTGGIVVGQVYRWYIGVSKTNAGTATPIWTPRIGSAQTTADTTVLTITGTAQVATTSGTLIVVICHVRTASATGVIVGSVNTGAASFGIGGNVVSGSFDTTGKAGQRFGLCVNSGASAAWTVNSVSGEIT